MSRAGAGAAPRAAREASGREPLGRRDRLRAASRLAARRKSRSRPPRFRRAPGAGARRRARRSRPPRVLRSYEGVGSQRSVGACRPTAGRLGRGTAPTAPSTPRGTRGRAGGRHHGDEWWRCMRCDQQVRRSGELKSVRERVWPARKALKEDDDPVASPVGRAGRQVDERRPARLRHSPVRDRPAPDRAPVRPLAHLHPPAAEEAGRRRGRNEEHEERCSPQVLRGGCGRVKRPRRRAPPHRGFALPGGGRAPRSPGRAGTSRLPSESVSGARGRETPLRLGG